MPLFNVQDSDRPMWVVAESYGAAVEKWIKFVAKENDMEPEDVEAPDGVMLVCHDDEFIE